MTTERKYFYAKTATIAFQPDGGTAIDVGSLQNVEIRELADYVELRSAGTNQRVDVAQHNQRVEVTATINEIDMELIADILSPSGTNWTSGTGTLSGIEDTDTASLFDVVATVTSTANKLLTVTVSNVYFPDIPVLVGTPGEWVGWELSGTGDDVSIVEAV